MLLIRPGGPARRRHLFEFEDLRWFPSLFRDTLTRWLAEIAAEVYLPVVPLIGRLLDSDSSGQIVDLCSGGSGPWDYLKQHVDTARAARGQRATRLTLTDLFPNVSALTEATARLGGTAGFRPEPVDARAVPADLGGVRTLFTSFHHLDVPDARAVLADAARADRPIGVFDATKREWATILGVLWAVPLGLWRSIHQWRPRSRARLFFSYVIPLIVLASVWDAAVSHLRAYHPWELAELTEGLGRDGYRWETGEACSPDRSFRITYVIGYPMAQA